MKSFNYYLTKGGVTGFGLTRSEANSDLEINLFKQGMCQMPVDALQQKQELQPWFPRAGMLHISRVGCIYTTGQNFLVETTTAGKVQLTESKYSMYLLLAQLFGGRVSYRHINVVLKEEINSFFKVLGRDYVMLEEFPQIVVEPISRVYPDTVYKLRDGTNIIWDEDGQQLGLATRQSSAAYLVEVPEKQDTLAMLAYLAYRANKISIMG